MAEIDALYFLAAFTAGGLTVGCLMRQYYLLRDARREIERLIAEKPKRLPYGLADQQLDLNGEIVATAAILEQAQGALRVAMNIAHRITQTGTKGPDYGQKAEKG